MPKRDYFEQKKIKINNSILNAINSFLSPEPLFRLVSGTNRNLKKNVELWRR